MPPYQDGMAKKLEEHEHTDNFIEIFGQSDSDGDPIIDGSGWDIGVRNSETCI